MRPAPGGEDARLPVGPFGHLSDHAVESLKLVNDVVDCADMRQGKHRRSEASALSSSDCLFTGVRGSS